MAKNKCSCCGKDIDLFKGTYEEFNEFSCVNGEMTITGNMLLCPKCYIKFRKKLYKLLKTTS